MSSLSEGCQNALQTSKKIISLILMFIKGKYELVLFPYLLELGTDD